MEKLEEKPKEEPKDKAVDYTKLTMKERAQLLPPSTENMMNEFEQYKIRMGYGKEKMKSIRYKMSVYDDFVKEYEYRKKIKGGQRSVQRPAKKNRDYSR